MGAGPTRLCDEAARRTAMSDHDRSLLVEAGAGSGKTAIMAGRIAMMLAAGTKPNAIAAITFTELAASELLERIRQFVEALLAGQVPPEFAAVLSDGLSATQKVNLSSANAELDEITCTTIHGFCQRLIKPYPVEAKIDPGVPSWIRRKPTVCSPSCSMPGCGSVLAVLMARSSRKWSRPIHRGL